MADIFLKLNGIDGESKETGYEDQIEISSWSWGVSNAAHFGPGTGASVGGKGNFSDLVLTKASDKATVNLQKYCAWSWHIPDGKLSLLKLGSDGQRMEYLTIELTDIVVNSFSMSGAGGSQPMESVSLTFAQFKETYQPQGNTGDPSGNVDWGYNVQTGDDA